MNKKSGNPKHNAATSRLDLTLVPDSAVAYMALGLTEGHLKYGGYNWRVDGASASIYIAGTRRHLAKWMAGEECDSKSGVPHLASALAGIAIIVDALVQGCLEDDRPPNQAMTFLLDEFEGRVRKLQSKFQGGSPRATRKFSGLPPTEIIPKCTCGSGMSWTVCCGVYSSVPGKEEFGGCRECQIQRNNQEHQEHQDYK